ncbi:DUF1616 domain-containing protein [Chloroflexota bacterium]
MMEIDSRKTLLIMILVALLLFPLVAFTSGVLRIVLGLLFVLFSPGYALLFALFPRRIDLGGIERVALSLGLSIAIVPTIGLILNYTPWGIRLYPCLISITIFVIVSSAVAWYRQQKLPAPDRLSVTFRMNLPRWSTTPRLDKVLSVLLVVAVVVALSCLGYVVATPKQNERFTEFYILNIEGKAEDYPQQVMSGEPVDIIIGVANHESEVVNYRIDVRINGIENRQITIKPLANEEKLEKVVSFVPQASGENKRVEFWLYRDDETTPYFEDPLHLYIDVTEPLS